MVVLRLAIKLLTFENAVRRLAADLASY